MRPSYLTLWPLLLWSTTASWSEDPLTVTTSTGIYTGLIDPDYNNVKAFRSIPFAEPPVGKLRWRPPVPLSASRRHHFSHRFPSNCAQYLPKPPTLWSTVLTDYGIDTLSQVRTAGTVAQTSGEDCLALSIWTPLNVTADAKLPVAFFIHGGAFVQGGIDSPYLKPTGWVSRSQQHIVVSINYRVNIFGFPNAAGLDDQNVGFLDARLALEWVYANIEAFGGDSSRITLWGQSAGAVAADIVGFANWDDPLASSLFLQSGNAIRKFARGDDALQTNFTFVAKSLGCDFSDAEAELECMQSVPANLITNFVGQYGDNDTEPVLLFRPTVDEKTIFSNYTLRAKSGFIPKIPALISTTANEDASLIAYPANNLIAGPNKTAINLGTLAAFVCPAYYGKNVRVYNNLTTYRYQYAGNFSNISPYPWLGAYHASDIPPIFGTYDLHGGSTELEVRVSQRMQDYVLAFISDPLNGLKNRGWAPDNALLQGSMNRFAAGSLVERLVKSSDVDDACRGIAAYNASPT
ncbi:putative Carboxylic ester hydrolase [Seiridium cardinale]|uniref:Carboxylic ester hydrolase n=1 Tax=Seiridium cardinale TaxID=138064 RepID=A0ABR2XM78_9PEZI